MTTDMRELSILFGPLEDIIRAGLLPVFQREFCVLHSGQTGAGLIDEARRLGCRVIIMRRDELAMFTDCPDDVVCIGVASAAADLLVVASGRFSQHPDVCPGDLCEVIRDVIQSSSSP